MTSVGADAFAALEHIRAGDWDRFLPQLKGAIKERERVAYWHGSHGAPVAEPQPQPERTPEMVANGQVWVGMNYPDGSHGWEIRGTGVAENFFMEKP